MFTTALALLFLEKQKNFYLLIAQFYKYDFDMKWTCCIATCNVLSFTQTKVNFVAVLLNRLFVLK